MEYIKKLIKKLHNCAENCEKNEEYEVMHDLDDMATVIEKVCENGGCPPHKTCSIGNLDCHKCLVEWLLSIFQPDLTLYEISVVRRLIVEGLSNEQILNALKEM